MLDEIAVHGRDLEAAGVDIEASPCQRTQGAAHWGW